MLDLVRNPEDRFSHDTAQIIKSGNVFSSINEMKLCFNLKDTMYFLRFMSSLEQRLGVNNMFIFSSRSDFKTFSY